MRIHNFSLLVVSILLFLSGCAARQEGPPTATVRAPYPGPRVEVFEADKPPTEKMHAIRMLSRIVTWHKKELQGLTSGPLLDDEDEKEEGKPSPAPPRANRQIPLHSVPPPEAPLARRNAVAEGRRRRARKTSRCRKAHLHARAICLAAHKICRLAGQLKEEEAGKRCRWARNLCRMASRAVRSACPAE